MSGLLLFSGGAEPQRAGESEGIRLLLLVNAVVQAEQSYRPKHINLFHHHSIPTPNLVVSDFPFVKHP